MIGETFGGRSWTQGKGEHMQVRERKALHQLERLRMLRVGLPGESGDHVGTQSEGAMHTNHAFDGLPVVVGRIPVPPHAAQDAVGSGLQRRVEVRRKARGVGEQRLEARVHLGRLNGRQAEAHPRHLVHQALHQLT
jgi:hypothetical protein